MISERYSKTTSERILSSSSDNAPTTTCRPPRPSTQCESVETTTRKRHLFFARAVQMDDKWAADPSRDVRVMFGTMNVVGTTRDQANHKEKMGPISGRRQQCIQSHRGVNGQPLFPVRSRECAMVEGGKDEWTLVPGRRRRAGPFHDEMAQGQGGQDLANPSNNRRQQQQQGESRWGGGVGRGVQIQPCTNAKTKWYIVWHSTGWTILWRAWFRTATP